MLGMSVQAIGNLKYPFLHYFMQITKFVHLLWVHSSSVNLKTLQLTFGDILLCPFLQIYFSNRFHYISENTI